MLPPKSPWPVVIANPSGPEACNVVLDDKISKEDLKVKRKEMMLSEAWISKLNAENVQNIVGKAGMKAIEAATGEKAFGNYR